MLLGFKKRFAEPIQIGTKVHTIRSRRKIPAKIGEPLYMYTGLRTNKCELITNKEKLVSKQKVWVKITFWRNDFFHIKEVKVCIDGRQLSWAEVLLFVQYDGFDTPFDFAIFWLKDYKKEFKPSGVQGNRAFMKKAWSKDLYHWTDLKY
jgi:hypothetical protein